MSASCLKNDLLRNPPAGVSTPRYDRSSLRPGIVHIGVGNFHRAHQAAFLERLFEAGEDLDWAVIGAGVRQNDISMREILLSQDCLTTVIELDANGFSASIRGSMVDFLPVDPAVLISTLAQPEIRIVSMTITEGGYFINAETGDFDLDHPEIVSDIEQPGQPRTVFGILLSALNQRYLDGSKAFSVVSCDNLPSNGHVTRRLLVGLSQFQNIGLRNWISESVATPNCMVDCITPASGSHEREMVATHFGIKDGAPVVCEPFRQWVLEDSFSAGRPALEKAGVEFVKDVAPYELMKLRILNGGHIAIAFPGALLGHRFVHDAIGDSSIRAFVHHLIRSEIIPTLRPISGIDFHVYAETVLKRFANPRIGDTIARLCEDSSNRLPKFILPSLFQRLQSGQSIDGLSLVIALWCRFCRGVREDGSMINIVDEKADLMNKYALCTDTDPTAFSGLKEILGTLGSSDVFASSFRVALCALQEKGVSATLGAYARRNST